MYCALCIPDTSSPHMLGQCTHTGISEAKKRVAKQRIMSRVSEAYGRMLLLNGLFQADGHPGNILVLPGM